MPRGRRAGKTVKQAERSDNPNHPHRDVVIDTNVLAHSENELSPFHADASEFVYWAANDTSLYWVLDNNGKSAPELQTSLLHTEYLQTVGSQSTAYLLFQNVILANGRHCFADRPGEGVRKLIRELVPKNRKDQVVLGAASGAGSRWLVSNDFTDFSDEVRERCRETLDVSITDCAARAA